MLDGTHSSNIATALISVASVNDRPLAHSQTVSTLEDTVKNITLTGFDQDGDSLTYIITQAPLYGQLSGTFPNAIYTPNLNETRADSFKFKVSDGQLDSLEATVSITLTPVMISLYLKL